MQDQAEDAPLWRVIADQLRADIDNEVYPPGAALPGEVALSTRYDTSRPTVRRAISELAGEGLVTAAHGRGTFTRPRPDRRTILIGGSTHPDLLEQAADAAHLGWMRTEHPRAARFRRDDRNAKVTNAIVTGATREQAEALRIETGDFVIYRFEHWRHRQTQRVISLTSVIPARLLGILADTHRDGPDDDADREPEHGETTALYADLEKHGPVGFTTTVTARMPRGDELDDLGMDTGTPLIVITRTMTDPHGRPLEATTVEAASDRFAVAADTDAVASSVILAL
jgi:DNA-binding GntR family transcriptional regulator